MSISSSVAALATGAAIDGRRVAVLSRHPGDAIEALLGTVAERHVVRVSRANGRERIEFRSGVRIDVHRFADGFRGRTVELAVVPIGLSWDDMETIKPSIAGTRSGEIVGYH